MKTCLVSILLVAALCAVGCQSVESPANRDFGQQPVDPAVAAQVPGDSRAPLLLVTGDYVLPFVVRGADNPPVILDLPAGTPVSFCWSILDAGGASQPRPRFGWNSSNGESPGESGTQCTDPVVFHYGTHVVEIEAGEGDHVTRVEIRINIAQVALEGAVDLQPRQCPNYLNPARRGLLRVVLFGTADLDVHDVIPEELRLGTASPVRQSIGDVGSPPTSSEDCACSSDAPDGSDDIELWFRVSDIASDAQTQLRGTAGSGDTVTLFLWGRTAATAPDWFVASDCVRISR